MVGNEHHNQNLIFVQHDNGLSHGYMKQSIMAMISQSNHNGNETQLNNGTMAMTPQSNTMEMRHNRTMGQWP